MIHDLSKLGQKKETAEMSPEEVERIKKEDGEVREKITAELEKMKWKDLAANLVSFNSQFIHYCRNLRVAVGQPKTMQKSFEEQFARDKGLVFIGGLWVQGFKGWVPDKVMKLVVGKVSEEELKGEDEKEKNDAETLDNDGKIEENGEDKTKPCDQKE